MPPVHDVAESGDSSVAVEPMDCYPTPPPSASPSEPKSGSHTSTCYAEVKDSEMQEPDGKSKENVLNYDDLCLIVDMFYLPYEHGNLGLQIMQEFQWLKANANCMVPRSRKCGGEITPEVRLISILSIL